MKRDQKRNRGRVLTLNHNENSNKNININISYNLGQLNTPFHRRLQTENYNPNNSLSSNYQHSAPGIKGKKIDNKEVEYAFEQDKLLHNSLSKESHAHPEEEECEISIKVIKKKKGLLGNEPAKNLPQNKLSKYKTNQSMKAKRRLHTEQAVAPSTTKNQPNKNFFSTTEHGVSKPTDFNQLAKLYRETRRKSRSCSRENSQSRKRLRSGDRKKAIDQQKEHFQELVNKLNKNQQGSKESLNQKSLVGKIKKRNKSELVIQKKDKKVRQKSIEKIPKQKRNSHIPEDKQRLTFTRKSVEKQNPRQKAISDYRAHYDIEPFIMSRLMNSSLLSQSLKMSQLNSKQLSQRKYIDVVEESLAMNKNSLEIGIKQMRDFEKLNKAHLLSRIPQESSIFSSAPQQQIAVMNKAASLIKEHWKEWRRRRILQYYSSIFNKNKSANEMSDIMAEEHCQEADVVSFAESFENNQYIGSPFKQSDLEEKEAVLREQYLVKESGSNSYKQQNDSGSEKAQSEQFHFDINKYQQQVSRSIQQSSQPCSQAAAFEQSPPSPMTHHSPAPQDIHLFKQQQLQQWNHINKLINWQLNHQQQMDPHLLLQELMKQSELNKRWIEESCDVSGRNEPSQPNSRPGSGASQRSETYKNLIEEKGIADRLRKNCQNIKAMLCNTYEIDKSEKSISRHSNSAQIIKKQPIQQKSQKASKGGNSAKIDELMTYELMNDDDSDCESIPFKKKRKREKSELIDRFLDCGLNQCGFEEGSRAKEPEPSQEKQPQKLNSDEELRRRSRNIFVNGQRKDPILSPKVNPELLTSQPTLFEDSPQPNNLISKINEQPVRSILINEDSQTQSLQEQEYGDNEPVSKFFQQQKVNRHSVFESICNSVLEQFCIEISNKQKFLRDFNNCFSGNKAIKLNKQKGIKTNYASIKAYLVNLVDYIMSHEQERAQVLRNINATLGPTSTQMLYYLRIEDYSDYQSSEEDEDTVLIVSYEVFQRFEMFLDRQQNEDSSYKKNSKLQGYTFAWHRALLECMNETLDEQRPFGIRGKPYDWEVQHRLKNIPITEHTLQKHLQQSASKVLQIVSFLGGILFQKQDSPFYGTSLLEEHKMQINEDRLSRILATELFETEDQWVIYNEEKLQLMIELSSLVCERIMFEAAAEFNKLRRRRALLV